MDGKIPPQIQKLIDIYKKAQDDLIKTITEKEAKGNVTSYQKSLLRQLIQILQKLDEEAKNWTDEAIPSSYQQGIDDVNSKLEDMGINLSIKGGALNEDAISLLAENAYSYLHDANNFVGRRINDAVRQAGIDAVANKIATGSTVKQCKKNLIDSLISNGINTIKDKRGRNISLPAYAEVVARSTTREATNTATLNQLKDNGYDLVKMSSHSPTCSICAIYQGRVYSISGNNPDYPPLDTAYSGEYANIHPNCTHVLEPYIPEYADDPEGDKEFSNRSFELTDKDKKMLDEYNKQQAEKAQVRRDRKQYQDYKAVLGNEVPGNFGAFRSMKLSNSENWQDLKGFYNYLKDNPDSDKIYYNINKEIEELKQAGTVNKNIGVAIKPINVMFENIDPHATDQMLKRQISQDDVKLFINTSKIMFKQANGTKYAYYSQSGSAVIILKDGMLKTAFPSSWYDNGAKAIMEVVNKYVK